MTAFAPVPCPRCSRPKIGEIVSGVSRFKCPSCKTLVLAGRDQGGDVRVLVSGKALPNVLTYA